MIKPVKNNKRMKWIDSRYARPYKCRLFLRNSRIAQVFAVGLAHTNAIKTAIIQPAIKKLIIADSVVATINATQKILKQQIKGRVTQ